MGPVHKELTTSTCTTKINAHENKKLWAQSIKREIFLHRKFLRLRYIKLVGYKHRASEGVFYIGGRGCVLCQFIELVMFARCAFIFALRNIVVGGYLDTRRNI